MNYLTYDESSRRIATAVNAAITADATYDDVLEFYHAQKAAAEADGEVLHNHTLGGIVAHLDYLKEMASE